MAGGLYGSPETNAGIEYCYSTGTVVAAEDFGGSIGKIMYDTFVNNTFWDIESSNMTEGIGEYVPGPDVNVEGKTTEEMKREEMVGLLNGEQGEIWTIDPNKNDGYPILNSGILSVPNHQPSSTVAVYPTVTADFIRLESDFSGNFRIVDMAGKVLTTGKFDKTKTIDVSDLQAGVYLMVIQNRADKTVKRFIKK